MCVGCRNLMAQRDVVYPCPFIELRDHGRGRRNAVFGEMGNIWVPPVARGIAALRLIGDDG